MKQTFQLNLFTFPLWWYSVGLGLLLGWCKRSYHMAVKRSGFALFIRYMNAPLYGDYTRSGRIVSFFLRIVLLVVKVGAIGLRSVALFLLVVAYLAVLPLSILLGIYSLLPL